MTLSFARLHRDGQVARAPRRARETAAHAARRCGGREGHALALPGRQPGAAFADLGLVAVGQPQDHLMHAGHSGGADHVFVATGIHAGNIVAHRAVE
jgi:hypothetical protein